MNRQRAASHSPGKGKTPGRRKRKHGRDVGLAVQLQGEWAGGEDQGQALVSVRRNSIHSLTMN